MYLDITSSTLSPHRLSQLKNFGRNLDPVRFGVIIRQPLMVNKLLNTWYNLLHRVEYTNCPS